MAFPVVNNGTFKNEIIAPLKETIFNNIYFNQLEDNLMIYFVISKKEDFNMHNNINIEIEKYISENYIDIGFANSAAEEKKIVKKIIENRDSDFDKKLINKKYTIKYATKQISPRKGRFLKVAKNIPTKEKYVISLSNLIKNLDASFADTLLKIIDRKGLTDSQVYQRANIDRKLFSKIRNGSHPKKITAIALCLALELNINDTNNLLARAGYVLTNSEYFDVIIKYHIEHKIFNINEINEALFKYDQPQLGVV